MPLNSIRQSPLYAVANPKSIALFGASNHIDRMGTITLGSIAALGFAGPIYPIHPKESQVRGYRAYRDVRDLPQVPDLAIILLPSEIVAETLEACGQKGIRHAIIVSAGFKESGDGGVERENALKAIASRYNMRFVGPNCLGVANPHAAFNPTPFEFEGRPGYIGLASQSGSFVTQMFNYLAGLHLGFSTAFSVGNEADIDLVDCLEYLGACPHTRVIALYIEGIRRGRAFVETARRIAVQKPIVALYVGGSDAGRRAGFSHTGSLAGPDRLYDGIFRQSGIIRAGSLTELFDLCWALGSLPPVNGSRVILQTHSGGPGAVAADACGRAGLSLPALSEETKSRLKPFLPKTASVNNPVDLTFFKNPNHYFLDIPQILLEDPSCDILLAYLIEPAVLFRRGLKLMGFSPEQAAAEADRASMVNCQHLIGLAKKYSKPIVGFTFRSLDEPLAQGLIQQGVPVFPEALRAVRAIQAMVEYDRLRKKLSARA